MLGCSALATSPLAIPAAARGIEATIEVDVAVNGALTFAQAQDTWTDVADIEISTVFTMVEIEALTT